MKDFPRLTLFGDDKPKENLEEDIFYTADTGGLRNENLLPTERKELVKQYAISLGMREDGIFFSEDKLTGYGDLTDRLRIGTDVFPKDELDGTETANARMSYRCSIAHEIIGHRLACGAKPSHALVTGEDYFAYQAGEMSKTEYEYKETLDEVQASIRACKFTTDLTDVERADLFEDAMDRLKNKNIIFEKIKDLLYINERGKYYE